MFKSPMMYGKTNMLLDFIKKSYFTNMSLNPPKIIILSFRRTFTFEI